MRARAHFKKIIKSISGYLLLTFLLFLSLELLMTGYLYLKIQRAWGFYHAIFQIDQLRMRVKNISLNIEKAEFSNSHCQIQGVGSVFSWDFYKWQQTACHFNQDDLHFLFFVENLGENPCAHVLYSPKQIAVYQQFHYIAWSDQISHARIRASALVVRGGIASQICERSQKMVLAGRVWWQEIPMAL